MRSFGALSLLSFFTGFLAAQTVAVSPTMPSVGIGSTVQFSATVTGLSNTAVTWSAGGVAGGNTTAGTISATGLYTAPAALPGQNPVMIVATSVASPKTKASTYVNILSLGPTITSVSPNPLPLGTYTVTIYGSGFQPYAVVNNSGIQLTTSNVTPTTITAGGWQGKATSATFTVKNPGSTPSNPLTIPVGTTAPTYTLTVVNGTGSGTYAAGTVVTIKAGPPPDGQTFSKWTGAAVANPASATTTLTMPAANTTVTANYTSVPTYTLTVVNGGGSGTYAAGAIVSLTAKGPPPGQVFAGWTGATVANPSAPATTLVMPAANTTVTATYSPIPTYSLTVVNGSGSGTYAAGAVVNISANAAPDGQVFKNWSGAAVANPGASNTTVTMPAANTTVTANYAANTFTLTVVNGSGSGSYAAGAVVSITANSPPAGQVFAGWTGATVANPSASSTTLTMPAANTTVTANYAANTFTLTVVNGSGSGSYAAGATVNITANGPPSGQVFAGWTGATVATPSSPATTLTMPAANTTVTATYSAAATYSLTVVSGSGSGSYAAGAVVNISANAPPAGQSFSNWTGASVANPTSASTTLTMPAANTTVTANYAPTSNPTYTLTVVNGTGSGSYTANTVVTISANTPPAGQVFQSWVGLPVANVNAATTTLTMVAYNAQVTANFGPANTSSPIPFPVASHPRLWVTPADLPRLQSWATSSNKVYQQGLLPVLQQAVANYTTHLFPGGVANPSYPDPGDTQGYTGLLTEEWGAILAFNSLIDPNPANRILYAQYARNMLMYVMNQAALGTLSGAPFRDSLFATYNRANGSGEEWPLIVDWIYNAVDAQGQPILTAADKLTIRNVFMMWASKCETASTTGGDSPNPPGVMNSFQLLANNLPYRMAANNYYTGHARLMTMMALAIDPADDPAVVPGVPVSQLGNSLRSYLSDALGAWQYQQYAMYGDGPTVAAAYGIPGNPTGAGFGLASGGLPPEGMLYGVSYANLLGGLLALQTAGFNNPAYAGYTGPQIGMVNAPMWDRFVKGILTSLTPAPLIPTSPGEGYLGQVYQFASYGDLLRFYVTPDYMGPFALLALLEQQQGQTTHLDTARWFDYNVVQGGPNAFYQRMNNPYSYIHTILYYLLYDPAVPATSAADPRPGYPTMFVDPGAGRIVAHTDWTPTGTMFDYRATWLSINHQDANTGQFELYRNGEWLTKELSNYDNNGLGMTTYYHNTLGLQNTCNGCADPTQIVNWWEQGELANGSQWMIGQNAGDPVTQISSGPGFVYANTDMTKLYNRPNQWTPANSMTAITQATRSIMWLNNDYIIVYDRATSNKSGLFKRWNLTLITNPAIIGNVATETLPSGQQLFVQSLLPAGASITARNVVADLTTIAELENAQYVMTIQDPSNPTDTRFLHVLQGANAGAAMVPAARVQSTTGTAFDGAVFGSSVVYFPVSAGPSSVSSTLPAPAGIHTAWITGLTPNGSYAVSVAGGAITIAGGAGSTADAAGVLRLTF
jgi:Divergent InlB B-repeat domain